MEREATADAAYDGGRVRRARSGHWRHDPPDLSPYQAMFACYCAPFACLAASGVLGSSGHPLNVARAAAANLELSDAGVGSETVLFACLFPVVQPLV